MFSCVYGGQEMVNKLCPAPLKSALYPAHKPLLLFLPVEEVVVEVVEVAEAVKPEQKQRKLNRPQHESIPTDTVHLIVP